MLFRKCNGFVEPPGEHASGNFKSNFLHRPLESIAVFGDSKFNDGNPYGVGVVTGAGGVDDTANTALDHLVTRVLSIAKRLES